MTAEKGEAIKEKGNLIIQRLGRISFHLSRFSRQQVLSTEEIQRCDSLLQPSVETERRKSHLLRQSSALLHQVEAMGQSLSGRSAQSRSRSELHQSARLSRTILHRTAALRRRDQQFETSGGTLQSQSSLKAEKRSTTIV